MRGAPQSIFSTLIRRISARRPASMRGRPPRFRDFQRQYRRKPARCQRTSVSGRINVMALRIAGNQRYSWMKNNRSLFVNWTRPLTLRCSTVNCCLSAAFSASSRLLDLKSEETRFKNRKISPAIVADVKRFSHQIKRTKFSAHTVDRVSGCHRPKPADRLLCASVSCVGGSLDNWQKVGFAGAVIAPRASNTLEVREVQQSLAHLVGIERTGALHCLDPDVDSVIDHRGLGIAVIAETRLELAVVPASIEVEHRVIDARSKTAGDLPKLRID